MKNYEIESAWQYHDGTKHPNGMLLNRAHTYHPANRPIPYKIYKDATRIKLLLDKQPSEISALDAISISTKSEHENIIPDINMRFQECSSSQAASQRPLDFSLLAR
ncbi:hypothetical protein [Candidatus Nitrosotalea sp. TS]|uniref:hypothetical protein n=1 Tax=Candidatus Nitrosotalea sp. TS TaxID=2341020 RepID=UPI00140C3F57|nr:hypothetical protein [Candidatus Nitrosotalea sp. TS]